MGLKCSRINEWPPCVSVWSVRGPLEAFCHLTTREELDLNSAGSHLTRGIEEQYGRGRLFAEDRGTHEVLSFLTIRLPRGDFVCFITTEKF